MGAAKTSEVCNKIVFDQVSNVASMALSVASMGGGGKLAGIAGKTGIRAAFVQLQTKAK